MKHRPFAWLLLGALAISSAYAIEPFVIKDIRVEGIQRTEAGTIFSYLPVKVGETMTDEKAAAAIRALYATGFFKDVSLEVENGVLIVTVQERPAIAQIDFVGNKEFDKDTLKKGLQQIGLAESRIFDQALLDKAEQELKRQYLARGRYSASITTTVTPLERNRVGINFAISEGDAAKIRGITIIGARAFVERDLVKLFVLRTPGLMTWYSKNDQYSRQKLAGDLETLRSFYLDRGYLEFNIDSTQVSITPDKKDIYITISITEGQKYTVSDIKLAGDMLVPESELRALIKLKSGEVFSRALLTESTKQMSDRLGNDGYAFANVNAAPDLDKEHQRVAFTFFIDPGRRVYVRRLNVTGNTRTRDEVIRREMRQLEGGWYSAEKIQRSKQRIDRLGYFTEVNVETPSVAGSTDQVDVNVNVTEKPTGAVLLGAGFSSADGIIISGSITQNNVLGSGNYLATQINTSKINTTIALSYTNPYYTVDGISRGFDVYKRNLDPGALSLGAFKTSTLGAGVRFGVPVTERDIINYGLGVENTQLTVYDDPNGLMSPQRYIDFRNAFGGTYNTLVGSAGWARDGRDSLIYPMSGRIQRLIGEVGLPGGDLTYYKLTYLNDSYFPIGREYALRLNGQIGYAHGYDDKPLPFFKNLYAGGVSSVRGYQTSTIGPKDSNGDPTGGGRMITASAEFLAPFPGLANDKSVRLSGFVDAGMIGDTYDFGSTRYSAGFAVSWVSPFGPLKVSYGKPINPAADDRLQRFQFQFGSGF